MLAKCAWIWINLPILNLWVLSMTELSPKTMSHSQISIAQLMQPEHANNLGNVHGGWIMKLADECGALACMRHAQRRVVTVAVDSMTFQQPIKIGDLVNLRAEVTYTGRTSMEAEVHVEAENPITGVKVYTNNAHLVYVPSMKPENLLKSRRSSLKHPRSSIAWTSRNSVRRFG